MKVVGNTVELEFDIKTKYVTLTKVKRPLNYILKLIRTKSNMTLERVSKNCGVSVNTIKAIESGIYDFIKLNDLINYCRYLKISLKGISGGRVC